MSVPSVEKDLDAVHQALSVLMDGEADAQAALAACAAWRDQPSARQAWHAWHVGGDVLRSENLACAPGRDEAFLDRLRVRLAEEPVVLSPQPSVATYGQARVAAQRRRRWAGAMAVAAGFVVVAGALVVLRAPSDPAGGGPLLAQGGATATPVAATSSPALVKPQMVVASRQLIRDARLDQYLAAHKQQSVFGVPAGFMLDAPMQAPVR